MSPTRRLPARFMEHPGADRHDEARLLRPAEEDRRGEHSAFGTVPPQEGLDTDKVTLREHHLGLVDELEFAAFERFMELLLLRVAKERWVERTAEPAAGDATPRHAVGALPPTTPTPNVGDLHHHDARPP